MDPESARAAMARFYAAMRAEVENNGGTVAKFSGDGLLAVFGIPDVHEDDAVRALETAAGMNRTFDKLAEEIFRNRRGPIALKIGINTGEVAVGAADEDIVGDAINTAARLETSAAPGEVLVGEDTWRLTRSAATYEPVAPLHLKGKSEPVVAHRLVSVHRSTVEPAGATFVGRDTELGLLVATFEDAIRAHAVRLASIVGSPGLGKTRLAGEFTKSVSDRALVLETRCSAAALSTFAPIADALRSAAAIEESALPQEVMSRFASLLPDDEDRDRIVSHAAALLGAASHGSTEETFWAVRRLLEAAARERPVVLVIDDLHWGEPRLLDLVEHLAEWIRTAAVLIVTTGRPELRDVRPSLVDGGRVTAAIALTGLDSDGTERLARGLLGSDRVPAELVARLPTSTDGNPLFVREVVRMLVDDRVLKRNNGEWVMTVDPDEIEVPPTIQSLLAARVDRLHAEERSLLELASVVGKEFYRGALVALAPANVREGLDSHLESLRRQELIEPAGTYWIDEPVYLFHHALIRDAAYRRLLKEARAELHERVADWLDRKTQSLVTSDHDELVGYHLEQAHDSLRQLGTLADRARDLGRRASKLLGSAAERALDRDDLPSAAALAGRAVALLDADDPDRAELLVTRCEAVLSTGDVGAGVGAVRDLVRVSEGSPRLTAWAVCFDGQLANLTDPARLHETAERLADAAVRLTELGDASGAAKAHTEHATALGRLGRVAECESVLDKALSAARDVNDRRRINAVLASLPPATLWGPSPVARAGGRCLDVVRLLRITTGSPAVEAVSTRCQSVLESLRGRSEAARRRLRRVRESLEELGLRYGLLETELFAGIVELNEGDPSAAEPHLRSAHRGFRAMGVDVDAAQAAALLARACLALDCEEEALALTAESEALGGDDLKTAIAWRAVRAQILSRRGKHKEARQLAQAAADIAAETDALVDHGEACVALAAVCRAAGDEDAARNAEERAASLFGQKGATALLERLGRDVTYVPTVAEPAAREIPDTVCMRVAARFSEAFGDQRWDDLEKWMSPDTVFEDRRPGLQSRIAGLNAVMDVLRGIAAVGGVEVSWEPIAVRGERLILIRGLVRGVGDVSFEASILQIQETDADGLISLTLILDPDDLDGAVVALDELAAVASSSTTPLENAATRTTALFMLAFEQKDWERLRTLLADDHFNDDRRTAIGGRGRGGDRTAEMFKMMSEALGLVAMRYEVTAVRGDRLCLCHGSVLDVKGNEIELRIILEVNGQGRICRSIYFDFDRPDDALAALEERFRETDDDR